MSKQKMLIEVDEVQYYLQLIKDKFETYNLGIPERYAEHANALIDLIAAHVEPEWVNEQRAYWAEAAKASGSGIWRGGKDGGGE